MAESDEVANREGEKRIELMVGGIKYSGGVLGDELYTLFLMVNLMACTIF